MRVRPCGRDAVLLDCADLDDARRRHTALVGLPEVQEAVLGARTVLLRGDPPTLRALAQRTPPAPDVVPPDARAHVLAVHYDGPDLADVARATGLDEDEVVAAHTGTPWTVAFGGFAPGFAYLVGGDPRLVVPRRPTPRSSVPAGAVGLADAFSGVYPRSSPGGWRLLGTTDAVLFDVDRSPAALLAPGDTVRFVAATAGTSRDRGVPAPDRRDEGRPPRDRGEGEDT
jgi:allophanate hydrolase subunit 1